MDIQFATIDNGPFAQYLGTCGLDVIVKPPDAPPATIYNRVLDETSARYVCFIHADVTCKGLVPAIERTIEAAPGRLLGAVGVNNGYVWSRAGQSLPLITADSCCLVVDRDLGLRFDDVTFDEYHLYVEDLCMQAGGASTLLIDAFDGMFLSKVHGIDHVIHHSHTYRKRGPMWGKYHEYHKKLLAKWPGAQTT